MNYYNFIAKNEGIRTKPYRCTAGYLTIGIGHNCDANPTKPIIGKEISKLYPQAITYEEIKLLFNHDLANAIKSATKHHPDFEELPDNYKLVIVDMIFQIGSAGYGLFKNFKMGVKLRNTDKMIKSLLNSKVQKQTPNRNNARIELL